MGTKQCQRRIDKTKAYEDIEVGEKRSVLPFGFCSLPAFTEDKIRDGQLWMENACSWQYYIALNFFGVGLVELDSFLLI